MGNGTPLRDHDCVGAGCKCQQSKGRLKEPRHRKDIVHSKSRSRAQEGNIANRFKAAGVEKARRVPGSGAFAELPGDIDGGQWFQGEAKMTRTGRLTLKPEWYDKIERQARDLQKLWWFVAAWVATDDGRYRKVVVVSEDTFFELIRRLKETNDN